MNIFKFISGRFGEKRPQTEYAPEMSFHDPIHDKSEGGEYMDDGIRMHEQPLQVTDQDDTTFQID